MNISKIPFALFLMLAMTFFFCQDLEQLRARKKPYKVIVEIPKEIPGL